MSAPLRAILLKSGLATWLLVVSTSPAFAHEHAGGEKPHRHGLGFLSGLTPSTLSGTEDGLAPNSRHFHLVILGIELHVPGTCPFSQPENTSLLGDQGFFQLGSEIATAAGTATDDAVCATIDPVFLPDQAVQADWSAGLALEPIFSSVSPLCHLARRLRSGAQRL